ncbi:hypothetical protein V1478_000854, partial [Vespula squamosa]
LLRDVARCSYLLLSLLLQLPSDSDTLGSSFLRLLHLGEHARNWDLLTRLNVSSLWDIGAVKRKEKKFVEECFFWEGDERIDAVLRISSLGKWSELWRILASRRPQPAKAAARGASLALSQRGSLKDPKRFSNLA